MMNGLMREATDGVATLEDIDEQTFVRFCEYAYMGDYTPAQQQLVLASSKFDRGECPAFVRDDVEAIFGASKKNKNKKGGSKLAYFDAIETSCGQCGHEAPKQTLWDQFQRRAYSMVSPKFQPRKYRKSVV